MMDSDHKLISNIWLRHSLVSFHPEGNRTVSKLGSRAFGIFHLDYIVLIVRPSLVTLQNIMEKPLGGF